MRGHTPTLLVSTLTTGLVLALDVDASATSSTVAYEPIRAQLERLSAAEQYIAYFTSLSYGPSDARVSADYIRALILTESGADPQARSP